MSATSPDHQLQNLWRLLATELIHRIASHLPEPPLARPLPIEQRPHYDFFQHRLPLTRFGDFSSLSRTCHHLYDVLTPMLYAEAIRDHEDHFLWAVCTGSEEAVDRFMALGLKIARREAYHGALYPAVSSKRVTMVEKLMKLYSPEDLSLAVFHGPGLSRPHVRALEAASRSGSLDIVKLLVGIPHPTHPTPACLTPSYDKIISREFYLFESLAYACTSGHDHVVAFLLDQGVDVNKQNSHGNSLLHFAQFSGLHASFPVVSLLLSRGANPNLRNSAGNTPLHNVCTNLETVKALVGAGADVNELNTHRWNVLRYCTTPSRIDLAGTHRRPEVEDSWNPDILRFYLESGADPNCIDLHGVTPLHHAASQESWKMREARDRIQLLLQFGANTHSVRAPVFSNMTPIELAMSRRHLECVELLLAALREIEEPSPEVTALISVSSIWVQLNQGRA